jgi:RNase P subunit RPR2
MKEIFCSNCGKFLGQFAQGTYWKKDTKIVCTCKDCLKTPELPKGFEELFRGLH